MVYIVHCDCFIKCFRKGKCFLRKTVGLRVKNKQLLCLEGKVGRDNLAVLHLYSQGLFAYSIIDSKSLLSIEGGKFFLFCKLSSLKNCTFCLVYEQTRESWDGSSDLGGFICLFFNGFQFLWMHLKCTPRSLAHRVVQVRYRLGSVDQHPQEEMHRQQGVGSCQLGAVRK